MPPECPLCHGTTCALFFEEVARCYLHCPDCDLRFLDPRHRLSASEERARYLLHNNDIADPGYRAFVKPLFDHVAARLAPGASGLDFGAGTGPVLADLLQRAGYEVQLFDPFFHPDFKCLERSYDFVVACEVVEHLFDPRAEFARLKGLLVEGGLLGMMTWLWPPARDFASWSYRQDPTHVTFYSRATFQWIQKHFGFRELTFEGPRIVSLRA